MKIMLATDGSEYSHRALAQTTVLASAMAAEVLVVLVSQIVLVSGSGSLLPVPDTSMELPSSEDATRILADAASTLQMQGIQAKPRHLVGHAIAETLLEEAERWNPDLIVVGAHGRTGVVRFLMGSVSSDLVQHARCSVMVVKDPDLIGHGVPAIPFVQTARREEHALDV